VLSPLTSPGSWNEKAKALEKTGGYPAKCPNEAKRKFWREAGSVLHPNKRRCYGLAQKREETRTP